MSLALAIQKAGSQKKLGELCGVSQPAVKKWLDRNKLPYTEWTGETNYAERIYKNFGVIVPPFQPEEKHSA